MAFLCVVLFCSLFLGMGFWQWRRQKARKKGCTAQVRGRVTEIEKREEMNDGYLNVTYAPVFAYTVNGYEFHNVSGTAYSHSRFKPGDEVTVFYNPLDPQFSYISGEDRLGNLSCIFFAACGAFGIILAIVLKINGMM
ncbi:MAG TPA: DUF3592 domain-containing protein [Clostridia bacterium]|nr:DUF3592 domain-containing protein [Clostridia bacterium]